MYQLYFYVPEDYLQEVKQAVFEAGAGKIGDYEYCCWQTRGQGQYRPLEGSHPFEGKAGVISEVAEFKVEMVCEGADCGSVKTALLKAHPYEEVAYGFIKIANFLG